MTLYTVKTCLIQKDYYRPSPNEIWSWFSFISPIYVQKRAVRQAATPSRAWRPRRRSRAICHYPERFFPIDPRRREAPPRDRRRQTTAAAKSPIALQLAESNQAVRTLWLTGRTVGRTTLLSVYTPVSVCVRACVWVRALVWARSDAAHGRSGRQTPPLAAGYEKPPGDSQLTYSLRDEFASSTRCPCHAIEKLLSFTSRTRCDISDKLETGFAECRQDNERCIQLF